MKNIVKYVVLGLLLVVIIVLGVMFIFKNRNEELVRYKFYDDDLIKIDNQTSMDIQANIADLDTLIVLVSSKSEDNIEVSVNVVFYDESYQKVSTEGLDLIVLGHGKQVFTLSIPELYEKYAGDIEVQVSENKVDNSVAISSDDIEMTETHTVDENLNTNFNVSITNNSDIDITNFSGGILLLKEGKIVGFRIFSQDNFAAHSTVSSTSAFGTELVNSQSVAIDFDEVILFPAIVNVITGE